MNHTKTNYFAMMLSGIILVGTSILPMALRAEVAVYLDPIYSIDGKDIRLSIENLMGPNFPKPKNQLPVLFVPGHDFGNGENFRESFQQASNNLPSFRDTLQLEENSSLGIEPYYMDLEPSTENEDDGIKADARKIEEAVNLILLHQGEPEAKTKKVVIIAYGSGAISTRFYLQDLWERQNKRLSFHPVSEFIALLPSNQGLNEAASSDFCGQLLASVTPGSRGNNEPIENGILYFTLHDVTLHADGNRDMVHMPEVICKALYTAFYHQAPPDELVFQGSDEKNPLSPPIIPSLQIPKREMGIVLLLDISADMSGLLPAIRNSTEPFLQLLNNYCRNSNNMVNLGIAVFPAPGGNDQDECRGQVISPMALVAETAVANAVKTIHCLKAQGNNPLLPGIDTALQMFSGEKRKVIILISNGHLDCPVPVNIHMEDIAIKSRIVKLDETGVAFYAVGLGQDIDRGHDLLRKLTGNRSEYLPGKFIPVNETDLGGSLLEAYQSILAEIMELEEGGTGIRMKPGFDKTSYDTGDTMTITATITKYGHPLTNLSMLVTLLNKSFTGVQGAVFQKSPLVAEGIKLYDDGSHGDREKNDGIYTNQYTETANEGIYRFLFHAAGETFLREKKESIYVAVKADPVYSSLSIRWRDIFVGQQEQYLYDVEFAPRDRYGNRMGAGHTVEVVLDYKDKAKVKGDSDHSFRLRENPDGTYSGEIGIMRSSLEAGARLVLMIDGKTFTTVEKIPGFKKWSLGIHGGAGFPVSNFKRRHHAGINFSGNIGYRLTPTFSLVGLVGYNYFSSSSLLSGDSRWWNVSANLRSEIVKNPLRFYINAGAGLYISRSGVLKSGVNVGTGAVYSWRSNYSIELGADFHLVDSLGNDSTFLVTHAGLVYRL